MKNFLISLFMILITGCANQAPKPLTDVEKETIKNDVKKELLGMIEACNKIDIETALTYFLDSPDFSCIVPDGGIMDFAQFKKANEDMFNAAKSIKNTIVKEDIKVLGNDQVLDIWQYNAEIILNSGEKFVYDKATVTCLYKKIEGVWKIVFMHESSLPPVIIKL